MELSSAKTNLVSKLAVLLAVCTDLPGSLRGQDTGRLYLEPCTTSVIL